MLNIIVGKNSLEDKKTVLDIMNFLPKGLAVVNIFTDAYSELADKIFNDSVGMANAIPDVQLGYAGAPKTEIVPDMPDLPPMIKSKLTDAMVDVLPEITNATVDVAPETTNATVDVVPENTNATVDVVPESTIANPLNAIDDEIILPKPFANENIDTSGLDVFDDSQLIDALVKRGYDVEPVNVK